jgi:hypothetical protein
MKKKNLIKIAVIALILIGIFVTVSTISVHSFEIKFGKKTTLPDGTVTGCSGNGSQCMYIY